MEQQTGCPLLAGGSRGSEPSPRLSNQRPHQRRHTGKQAGREAGGRAGRRAGMPQGSWAPGGSLARLHRPRSCPLGLATSDCPCWPRRQARCPKATSQPETAAAAALGCSTREAACLRWPCCKRHPEPAAAACTPTRAAAYLQGWQPHPGWVSEEWDSLHGPAMAAAPAAAAPAGLRQLLGCLPASCCVSAGRCCRCLALVLETSTAALPSHAPRRLL